MINDGSIASYNEELNHEQANVHVAEQNPLVCTVNEQWDDWWPGFIQKVEAYTRIIDFDSHCNRCAKLRCTNYDMKH